MEIADALEILLSSLPYKLPVFIVLLGGIVYCAVNFSKNPPVNRKVLGGLLILLAVDFLGIFVSLLNVYLYKNYENRDSIGYVVFAIGFLLSTGSAAGLGIILSAVWTNRTPE